VTKRLTVAQVHGIFESRVAAGPLLHAGKLDGAVNAPFQHVFGTEVHPTLVQKAAKLIDGISRAQAYIDGNKRLAWLSGVTLLEVNGLYIADLPAEEAAEFVLKLEGSEGGLRTAALWLNDRVTAMS
jgi:death-on-curing protein